MSDNFAEIESIVGYKFKDRGLLEVAMTHRSYIHECPIERVSYERLEFLGDAILEFVVSKELFKKYPEKSEGELTKLRASLVCEYTLSQIVKLLGLGEYIFLGQGENNSGGRNRSSILCDIFESILGAIYLDGGMNAATRYVKKHLLSDSDIVKESAFFDAKTSLQEYAQALGHRVTYKIIKETGPAHNKTYFAACFIDDKEYGRGEAGSKKLAEQIAAHRTLTQLGES